MGNETKEPVRLRTKPEILLPHKINMKVDGVVKTLTFTPKCDTPISFERADALVKSYPNVFELDKGPIDPSRYKMRVTFKREMVVDAINQLSDEETLTAYDFIQSIIADRGKKTVDANDDDALAIAKMNRKELVELAEQMQLEVPAGATKADLIVLIENANTSSDGSGS